MLRRRQINADPRGRTQRAALAAADAVRAPFERLAWLLERRLLWPLQARFAGWAPSGRAAGAGVLATLVAAAVAVGVLSSSGGNSSGERAAAPTQVAIATSAAQPEVEEPRGAELKGVPPRFHVGGGVGVAKPSGEAADTSGVTAEGDEAVGGEASSPEATAAATSSSKPPVPAGPAAMKVARRFSDAFVFYEVGEKPARAEAIFGETATPQLATALSERPPRQPEDGQVPKARVVNLVPGPRAGKAYTVSVSLLRVGLTSELRLEMRNKNGTWLVTDVRG